MPENTWTLPPGRWNGMIQQINQAAYDVPSGDQTIDLVRLFQSIANEVWDRRRVALRFLDRAEKREGLESEKQQHFAYGEVTMCNHMLHAIYYGLIDNHIINPGERKHD